jgi:ribosome biogenesis GTPase
LKLISYGANERFFAEAALYPNLLLARVISQYRDLYRIVTETDEKLAEVSGRFRHEAARLVDYPAVGDFVMVDSGSPALGNAIIQKVLSRKSSFVRAAVGIANQTQVIAANIDLVFVCMSLNNDYNLSRLERYLSVAWSNQAVPIVVLTKADLCADLENVISQIQSVAPGVDVVATSIFAQASYEKLSLYLKPGVTASFIGSSGVGKSTLINRLAGEEILATSDVRQDDKGRHTTTRRELFLLPQGGIVIDTPGMRELGVDSVNLAKTFTDIDELAGQCRFRDCTHTGEPGCAVRNALESGAIEQRRFANYQKLKKEARYDGLSSREIENEKIKTMFGGKRKMKATRDYIKKKDKT